jgi:hypothetical protein
MSAAAARVPSLGLRRLFTETPTWAARGVLLVGAIFVAAVVVRGLGFPIVLLPVVPLLARPLTNMNRAVLDSPRPPLAHSARHAGPRPGVLA